MFCRIKKERVKVLSEIVRIIPLNLKKQNPLSVADEERVVKRSEDRVSQIALPLGRVGRGLQIHPA
jgi:hypothetical protein